MPGVLAPIVGREREVEAVRHFARALPDGPAAFVLEGAAGVGKTAIWAAAVTAARAGGLDVRTCRCSESDSAWAFAGLGELRGA